MFYSDPFINDHSDSDVDYYNFYQFTEVFTEEEIDFINQWGEAFEQLPGEIGNSEDLTIVDEIRKSIISWIPYQEGTEWIYDRLAQCAIIANKEMDWNFNLSGFGDEMQYTKYFGTDKGHYSWHGDIGPGVPHRKLSIVVQLSDETNYEGGIVQLSKGSHTVDVPKLKGTVIIFPSFVLHRVLPVTSGERRSLVSWISGPRMQ